MHREDGENIVDSTRDRQQPESSTRCNAQLDDPAAYLRTQTIAPAIPNTFAARFM
jgi:hypothetical protein